MTSSEAAASAYAFEQLEIGALVRSRLTGVAMAGDDDAASREHERTEAVRAAVAEARADAIEESREQIAAALDALEQAAAGIVAVRDQTSQRVERDALELALALAEQIVAGALEVEPERVLDVVRGALRRLTDRQRITIVVNPDDAELLGEQLEALRGELGGLDEARIQSDRRVMRGGALVQTGEGTLDVQIATQLERARTVVAQELAQR
jgi:flagellar assembly protein FliH